MKTVAIIQARMGSTRLGGKVMMAVQGRPLLGWMLDRIDCCERLDEICVATTNDPRDDAIADFVRQSDHQVFRGSENDVLDRYYQAALMTKADSVVRITSDCPLLDPAILDDMIIQFVSGEMDFMSNSEPLPATWPDGMDVSIMTFSALHEAWREAQKPSEREHVTFFFWNNPDRFQCRRIEHDPDWSGYRLTVDYPEDFLLLQATIEHFAKLTGNRIGRVSMNEIIAYLNLHPEVLSLNRKYTRGLGWQSALEKDRLLGFK